MKLGDLIPNNALRRLNPHLFSPRPARGTGEVTREAELHEAIFDECRRRGWIALHGSMAARTHRTLGEPDFVILAAGGRVLFVECKSRAGKLSPAQAALKHHAEALGHTIHVVRSLAEFRAVAESNAREDEDEDEDENEDEANPLSGSNQATAAQQHRPTGQGGIAA